MKKSAAVVIGCAIALWLALPAWAQRGLRVGSGAALSARSAAANSNNAAGASTHITNSKKPAADSDNGKPDTDKN